MILEAKILAAAAAFVLLKNNAAKTPPTTAAPSGNAAKFLGNTTLPSNVQSPRSYVGGGTVSNRLGLADSGATVAAPSLNGAQGSFSGLISGVGAILGLTQAGRTINAGKGIINGFGQSEKSGIISVAQAEDLDSQEMAFSPAQSSISDSISSMNETGTVTGADGTQLSISDALSSGYMNDAPGQDSGSSVSTNGDE
jgi:hypothetical protein